MDYVKEAKALGFTQAALMPVSELVIDGEYWIDHTGCQHAGKAGDANG